MRVYTCSEAHRETVQETGKEEYRKDMFKTTLISITWLPTELFPLNPSVLETGYSRGH